MQHTPHLWNPPSAFWAALICFMGVLLQLGGCEETKRGPYRVGVLSGMEAYSAILDGFKSGMAERGYVEGESITYNLKSFSKDLEEGEGIVRGFVAEGVDLILAFPTEPAVAAKKATQGTGVSVVFCNAFVEGYPLVESTRRPGGNLTGVRAQGPDLAVKRFETLLDMAPGVRSLYIPFDRNYPTNPPALKMLREVASSKGITLVEAPVTSLEAVRADLEARAASGDIGMDAIQIMSESLMHSSSAWSVITQFADRHRLPIAGAAPFTARKGAVFSLSPDPYEIGRLAAPMADKILKGIPPGTIPVASPEVHLRINVRQAERLGLKVPHGLIRMAREVIR